MMTPHKTMPAVLMLTCLGATGGFARPLCAMGGEDGLRREVVRGLRRLPPPEGLLLRRAQRLLRRVAERSGVR